MITRLKILFLFLLCIPAANFAQIKGSKVNIRVSDQPHELNPFISNTAVGSNINEYLYQSLLDVDKGTGEHVPVIAMGLPEIHDNELGYTYDINPKAKWNTGKAITAEDVIFSLKMIKNPFLANQHTRNSYEILESAIKESSTRVTFNLSNVSPQSLMITSNFAIFSEDFFDPGHKMRELSFDGLKSLGSLVPENIEVLKTMGEKINGFAANFEHYDPNATCGPYVLSEWTLGDRGRIELTYNKKFWGRKLKEQPNMFFAQNIETITFHIVKDEQTVRQLAFDNKIDLITELSAKTYHDLGGLPPKYVGGFKFHESSLYGYHYTYIGMNTRGDEMGRKPFFTNFLVRRAFAHLMDVEYMLEAFQYSLGDRMASDHLSTYNKYKNPNLEPVEFNPELAKQLLTAAGWIDSDGNGIRDKVINGEKIDLKPELVFDNGNELRGELADYMKKAALDGGIGIVANAIDKKEYLDQLKSKNFDLCLGAWVPDPNEDSYTQVWHTKNWAGSGYNWAGFGDPHSDELVEQYENEPDPDKRKAIAFLIQQAIYDSQPYVFLWHTFETFIERKVFSKAPLYDIRPGFWVAEWEPKL